MRNSQIGRLDGLMSTNKQGRSCHEGATDSSVKIRPKGGLLFSCVLLGSFAREHGGCWAAQLPSGRASCRQKGNTREANHNMSIVAVAEFDKYFI